MALPARSRFGDFIDELAEACDAKAFHVGMDEVFLLADPDCPRCQGKDPAELFAGEVRALQAHLDEIGCRTWMWGDRFLDGRATGLGKWEASMNGTAPAIDQVPKDFVICDWHYDSAPETPRYFARRGFDVVVCPWREPAVALAELAHLRAIRAGADPEVARRGLGVVQTTWCGFTRFAEAYKALDAATPPDANSATEAARCFKTFFDAVRRPSREE
jgi:hypothetical protein